MKKLVLLALTVIVSFSIQAQDCSDLFISEYVVGSGNNRALELYNPTNAPIDLVGYKVGRFRNGAATPMLLDLSGTVPALGTFVIVIDKTTVGGTGFEEPADPELIALADTLVNPVYNEANSPFYFNGDDAVPLIKGDPSSPESLLDVVGKIGEDPGVAWSDTSGGWWTTDKTLFRRPGVLKGVTTNPAVFMVETEWDSLPENTYTGLGWHTCDCASVGINDTEVAKMNMFPNPAADKQLMVSTSRNMESIQVFNILGQEKDRVNFAQATDTHRYNLEHLQTGVYILRVTLRNGAILSRKVMLGK